MSSSRSKLKLTQYERANKYLIPSTELNAIAIINEITNNYKVIITSLNNLSQNHRKTIRWHSSYNKNQQLSIQTDINNKTDAHLIASNKPLNMHQTAFQIALTNSIQVFEIKVARHLCSVQKNNEL